MAKKTLNSKGKSVQFLFVMLLFFAFGISALFTILFGAKIYENIGKRMDENFIGVTSLSYISNQVKQADQFDAVSIENMEDVQVLKLTQVYGDDTYETLIYYQNGMIKELFTEEDTDLALDAGMNIMESQGLNFEFVTDRLLKVESVGDKGGTIFIAIRSGGGNFE